jgi:multiple sugar transport system substrate-binding protein
MRRRRLVSLSIAVIAVTGLVAACGSSGSSSSGGSSPAKLTGTVSVGFAGGGVINTYMADIIKHAEKELPGVKIKQVVYPTYDDQLNELPTEFAAGTAPDITLWDNSAPIAEFATQGAIASMNSLIGSTSVKLSAFPQALVNGWKIDGKLYGVPSYLQNSAYVYNHEVLGKAGITSYPTDIAQVGQDAQQVKTKTGKPGIVILENLFHLTQYMIAFGGGFNYGKTIDSAQNVAGMNFLLKLFADGAAASSEQLGAAWDGVAIGDNQAAMADGGPWYIGYMSTSAPKVSYTLEPIPSVTPGKPVITTYGGAYSISSKSANQALDMAVIAQLTNAWSQNEEITTNLGFVPAMTSYVAAYRAHTPEYAPFTNAVLAGGASLNYPVNTTAFGNALVAGFQQLVASHSTSSTALLTQLQKQYGS